MAFTSLPVSIRLFLIGYILTWFAMQFCTKIPTPPLAPVLASLPTHVYPATLMSWLSFACDSAMIAICMSLSSNISLTSCLLDCNPLTFICSTFVFPTCLSSCIQLSIFIYFGILDSSFCLFIFYFHMLLSLVCCLIQSLAPSLPHCMLSKVDRFSLVISSWPI